jgi:P27 family predicted phage terminase small subunit
MARRGPPPQPTALRLLRGNPGKRRINGREPRPPVTTPSCPRWLNPEAKRIWRETVPALKAMRILTRIDRDALAAYCQTFARWKAAEQFLDQHGEVYPIRDETGKIRCMQPFPQVAIARSSLQTLRSYQQEFGMTPSARTRVHEIPYFMQHPEDDEFFGPQPAPQPYKGPA